MAGVAGSMARKKRVRDVPLYVWVRPDELEAINVIRKAFNGMKADEAVERVVDMFAKTRNNQEFVNMVKKMKFI